MTRFNCLLISFCLLSFAQAVAETPPNVIIILADDLGRGDYSAFGTKDISTPHIDRLCREGMTFHNFYANSCVCSPTRAALLTGKVPDRVGVPGVIRHTPDNSWGWLSTGSLATSSAQARRLSLVDRREVASGFDIAQYSGRTWFRSVSWFPRRHDG